MRAVNHGRPRGRLAAGRTLLRAPAVPIQSVPCPDCKAPAGEPCAKSGNDAHASRRRMAIRALNAARTTQEATS